MLLNIYTKKQNNHKYSIERVIHIKTKIDKE